MDMKTVTLENGWTAVVADKPAGAGSTAKPGFAAELGRVAQAAAAGDGSLRAVYDGLSAEAKALLERLKAGTGDITTDEWSAFRRELRDTGLITPNEFADSDPNMVIVGYVDGDGRMVEYPFAADAVAGGTESGNPWGINWAGNPLQFLKRWLEYVKGCRTDLDLMALKGGSVYDTSHLTGKIESNEKVAALVKSLLECC